MSIRGNVIVFATVEIFDVSPMRHFHRIGPLGRFHLIVAMSVCLRVYVSVPFHVLDFEAFLAPTSRSRMSKIFRGSESFGKSAGKKWSQN